MQFVYVNDLVELAIKVIEPKNVVGHSFNTANPRAITQHELIHELARAAGLKEPTLVSIPRQLIVRAGGQVTGDFSKLYFGSYYDLPAITQIVTKAQRMLGFKPTEFATGLRATYRAYLKKRGYSEVDIEGIGLIESGVYNGTTFGFHDSALTRITVGQHTTKDELDRDWMLTHELIHMSFPDVPQKHHWIEEGIATYVEPIARVQIGQLTPEKIWNDMARQMPQGEPESSDRGLDYTQTWASTYWGGALFCLVADVRIRERTHNRKGLQDALRGILKAGGNIEADWPVENAFKAGDRAVGVPVLTELLQA